MTRRYRYQPAAASPARFLHVSGVGLRVDHVPAGPLWDRVQRRASPDEQEPTPPGSLDKCREMAGLFRSAALRAALTHRPRNDERGRFVENYPLPTKMALPPSTQTDRAALAEWSTTYQSSERTGGVPWQLQNGPAGMAFHQLGFKTRPSFEVAGVDLWRSACNAFDTQGDLNSLLVWAEDGYAVRAELGGWENPKGQRSESLEDILARPKRPGQLRDIFSGLLLTRPEAAEWLREWSLHVRDASQESRFPNGVVGRGPHGFGGLHTEAYDGGMNYRVSRGDFKPTPNVPSPWSRAQYEQYAQMPTLALLLKPSVASFGADMSEDQRARALEAALKSTLEDSLLERPLKRVFYSATSDRDDTAAALLARSMAKAAPQSGLLDPGRGFRLEQCLGGELGAASMNAAIGLASIAVWETNEPALVVNLRDPRGALVFGLLPPSAEQRARTSARPYVI
ncbi:DUF2875 family protein [Variovorax paradoxus]|uniref:Type VI lipase adapter protein Tla3 C-terminal domain-containing protein n=1 Tax=Variovorax paradoxus (strain EPS) TaxID=595537 RepID=E6UW84_VARPE|nr:DUF2875 family protein [Variovorax paradoxus]ADU38741.1 hypothetical protein Varpa_4576 [Variovorax paradoxus EPS]